MTTTRQIDAFFASKRIGFAGVSTHPDHFSRVVFRELAARGYELVPIHPIATEIEGRPAFATMIEAGPLDAVLVMTPRAASESVVRDAHHAGIRRIWLHKGIGPGAVHPDAVRYAREHGLDLIAGECPLMYLPGTQAVHRAHAAIRRAFGRYPDATPAEHLWPRAVGYGALAWTLATWAMLVVAGIVGWEVAFASRMLLFPAAFGLLAWMHARPDHLAPLPTAAAFLAITVVLELVLVAGLVQRSLALLASPVYTWLPLALAFLSAVMLGTRHLRPQIRHRAAA